MKNSVKANLDEKITKQEPKSTAKIILSLFAIIAISILVTCILMRDTTTRTVIAQLEAIKEGNIAQAYNMNSKAFKATTSYEVFTSYINSNPIFNHFKRITFSTNTSNYKIAYLKGIIDGSDKGQMDAEYKLIKENGKWKIEAIRLTPIGIKTRESTMQTADDGTTTITISTIHGIMTSDLADADGYVEETKNVLPRSANKIFVTAMLLSSKPDINVSATLKHIPTGVELGPIESKTTKAGNIMKAFSFTRENQLWPAGEYEAVIKLSSGDTQTIRFSIE